ncbi:hypothetical protein D3C75_1138760 [compost metagenome]
MTVDVLERVQRSIGDRHQLDHAIGRVVGQARALLELRPAQVVLAEVLGHLGQAGGQAQAGNQAAQVVDVDIAGHLVLPLAIGSGGHC